MEDINNYIEDSINKGLSLILPMNETSRVLMTAGAAKTSKKAGSRIGRLLALLSVLTAVGRGPRHGVAVPRPRHLRSSAGRVYPLAGGRDMGRLLQ